MTEQGARAEYRTGRSWLSRKPVKPKPQPLPTYNVAHAPVAQRCGATFEVPTVSTSTVVSASVTPTSVFVRVVSVRPPVTVTTGTDVTVGPVSQLVRASWSTPTVTTFQSFTPQSRSYPATFVKPVVQGWNPGNTTVLPKAVRYPVTGGGQVVVDGNPLGVAVAAVSTYAAKVNPALPTVRTNQLLGQVYEVPPTIDATGVVDVSTDMATFFASVPEGNTIRFQPGGAYRMNSTLYLDKVDGLYIDGNGARIFVTDNGYSTTPPPNFGHLWPRSRANIILNCCTNITITNLTIVGSNSTAGTDGPYLDSLEAQHGVWSAGSFNVTVESCTIRNVWGDTVYFGFGYGLTDPVTGGSRIARGLTVLSCLLGPTGRQGMAGQWGEDILWEGNTLRGVRRSAFDLEPSGSGMWIDRATIRNNTIESKRLSFVAAGGSNYVNNVLVEGNTIIPSAEPMSSESLYIMCEASDGARRRNWTVRNNTSTVEYGSPLALMYFHRVDGLTVTGNSQPIEGMKQNRAGIGVSTRKCCNMLVTGNNFPSSDGYPASEWNDNPDGYVCTSTTGRQVYPEPTWYSEMFFARPRVTGNPMSVAVEVKPIACAARCSAVVAAPTPVYPGTVYMVPPSIDYTGATNVSASLLLFFSTVPDGNTIRFQPGGIYRCEGTLYVNNRNSLFFDGNGATIKASTDGATEPQIPGHTYKWPRERAHWMVENGSDISFDRFVIEGPNVNGGLVNGYDSKYEEQCGFLFFNVNRCSVTNCEVHHVYGDAVEVAQNTRYVTVRGNYFHHIGRQGVAVVWGTDVVFDRNTLWYMSRSAFDLEPAVSFWFIKRVQITNNTFGMQQNVFVAALGEGPVDDILVQGNVHIASVQNGLAISMSASDGTRRKNWTVKDNRNLALKGNAGPLPIMYFTNCDGVTVSGNNESTFGYLFQEGSLIYCGIFIGTTRCCNVNVSGNTLIDLGYGPAQEWVNKKQGYVCA